MEPKSRSVEKRWGRKASRADDSVRTVKVLRSAWMPAPPDGSEPAMVRIEGV